MNETKAPNGSAVRDTAPNVLSDLLPEGALAAQLGITIRTLQRWRQLRKGPPWLAIGRAIFYRAAATRDWILRQERGQQRTGRGRTA